MKNLALFFLLIVFCDMKIKSDFLDITCLNNEIFNRENFFRKVYGRDFFNSMYVNNQQQNENNDELYVEKRCVPCPCPCDCDCDF